MVPFRAYHLQRVLREFIEASFLSPSDQVLAWYFKNNKSLGSKDRKFISECFYLIIRNFRFLKYYLKETNQRCSSENLVSLILEKDLKTLKEDSPCSQAIYYSVSDDFLSLLKDCYPEEYVRQCLALFQEEAPTSIRVNTKKISPKELLHRWEGRFVGEVSSSIPGAIRLVERYPLQRTKEFNEGLFEFQDLSSQKVSQEVPITASDVVLDYCAGAGGKSLVFAEKASLILLHDIRKVALRQAQKRLLRSGNTNFSIVNRKTLNKYTKRCHVVVIDAPCSGSGTFRRHPEGKWLLSSKKLSLWVTLQRKIVNEARQFVCSSGRLVYITCSLLPQENEEQKKFFVKTFGWEVEKETKLLPTTGSGDGMYSVIFKV